jgi:RND family efflux transporter MFP subunit
MSDQTNGTNIKKNIKIIGTILLAALIIILFIFSTEPTAIRTGATKQTAMLVDVISVQRGKFQPTIVAMGTVRPAKDIILSPRVNGEVISRSASFTPGGKVKQGDILLRLDPSDYKNALKQRQSELRQSVADLNIEMGRQNVAQKDYQLLEQTLSQENEALVLRKPQLNAARAHVEAARSSVAQAELELQRTNIRAPFDAQVLTRNVNIGSQVSPGEALGRLVGLDTYWVVASVPLSKIRWMTFPSDAKKTGSPVEVRNRTAWVDSVFRKGHVFKLIGELAENTRMARILITVHDPLAYYATGKDVPVLMIGAFVEVRIRAREIPDVFRLDRDLVRKNNTVWTFEDSLLQIQEVDIVFQDADYAYITNGLQENDRVVSTNLSTVVDGARLRLNTDGNVEGIDSVSFGSTYTGRDFVLSGGIP